MNFEKFYKNRHQILSGHINELKSVLNLGSDEQEVIFHFRKEICDSCLLKTNNYCDSKKWIHPVTLELKNRKTEGYIRGCGCRLSAKQRAYNAKCPAGFWGGEEKKLKALDLSS